LRYCFLQRRDVRVSHRSSPRVDGDGGAERTLRATGRSASPHRDAAWWCLVHARPARRSLPVQCVPGPWLPNHWHAGITTVTLPTEDERHQSSSRRRDGATPHKGHTTAVSASASNPKGRIKDSSTPFAGDGVGDRRRHREDQGCRQAVTRSPYLSHIEAIHFRARMHGPLSGRTPVAGEPVTCQPCRH
jgi:hypothetical protein